MTSSELASLLGISEDYMCRHWPKVKATRLKEDIQIFKQGRGENAIYGIKRPDDDSIIWDADEIEM